MTRTTGTTERITVHGDEVAAFIPYPLPPKDPPVDLSGPVAEQLAEAENALIRLDFTGDMVPALDWLASAFVRKEAVASSQIEGVEATLVDLLRFECGETPAPSPDVEEVVNCIIALGHAREEPGGGEGARLTVGILNEAHRRLMHGARGADKAPGEVRRVPVWIGGARPAEAAFVPPPPYALPDLLGEFEAYMQARDDLPALVRAGLSHVQFETIHPYRDGNGRIGRLLITLLLEQWGLLTQPLLYLSQYFWRHRPTYYRRLRAVTADGDWEGWLGFFLDGVAACRSPRFGSSRRCRATRSSRCARRLGV
jgi:Fic family protein